MAEQQPAEKQLSRMSLREHLGSRFHSLRSLRSRERRGSQDAPACKDGKSSQHGPTVMSPRSREGAKCFAGPAVRHCWSRLQEFSWIHKKFGPRLYCLKRNSAMHCERTPR